MRCTWLFDETVNAYMWLLQLRDGALCVADPTRLPTHFFSTFFFEKMFEDDGKYKYGSVKRWSKKVRRASLSGQAPALSVRKPREMRLLKTCYPASPLKPFFVR